MESAAPHRPARPIERPRYLSVLKLEHTEPAPRGGTVTALIISRNDWQARRGETGQLDLPAGLPLIFPSEQVVLSLAAALTRAANCAHIPTFALVMTEYFGGTGDQWACVFTAGQRIGGVRDVNDALRVLGVRTVGGGDEFDTVGLGRHRNAPDYLDRYEDLCDDLGRVAPRDRTP